MDPGELERPEEVPIVCGPPTWFELLDALKVPDHLLVGYVPPPKTKKSNRRKAIEAQKEKNARDL